MCKHYAADAGVDKYLNGFKMFLLSVGWWCDVPILFAGSRFLLGDGSLHKMFLLLTSFSWQQFFFKKTKFLSLNLHFTKT